MDGKSALWILFAYLLGSLPSGFVLARVWGVDILRQGSGNIGATNVMRALGKKAGFVVLLLDSLKGTLPVVLAQAAAVSPSVQASAGLAAVAGHCFCPWLRFRGGKAVATSLGVLLALRPAWALWGLGVFAIAYVLCKRVSLASLTAAAAVFLAAWLDPQDIPLSLRWGTVVLMIFVVLRHGDNIRRLQSGKEPTT
ncbi:MAG: glycerol-3-phosphate 1-O-acyltransferase PlsY [Myxococcota bacterium]